MRSLAQKAPQPTSDLLRRPSAAQGAVMSPVRQLQRRVGNQALQRLLQDRAGGAEANAPGAIRVQAKLTINTPGDVHEQEADRVAEQVMRMPEPSTHPGVLVDVSGAAMTPAVAQLQTKSTQAGGSAAIAPPIVHEVLRSSGQPLDASSRAFMEPRFGQDFGQVRVHTDAKAAESAAAVNARAYTVGGDVVFGSGAYQPAAREGRHLLAHELAHTLQQNGEVRARRIQRQHGPQETRPAGLDPTSNPAYGGAERQRLHAEQIVALLTPPAGRATLNFLPIIHDKTPADWGVTSEDLAVLDVSAYLGAGTWQCVITKADQQIHQGVRLLPNVVEVTTTLVAGEKDCSRLKTMAKSLNSVANQGPHSGFYMIAAVQAHENVHVTQWQAGMVPRYGVVKKEIEALTVPAASYQTALAAKGAIKALPAYALAINNFNAAQVAFGNALQPHLPIAPFNAAEHLVVDPMIATIRTRRTALKCPP